MAKNEEGTSFSSIVDAVKSGFKKFVLGGDGSYVPVGPKGKMKKEDKFNKKEEKSESSEINTEDDKEFELIDNDGSFFKLKASYKTITKALKMVSDGFGGEQINEEILKLFDDFYSLFNKFEGEKSTPEMKEQAILMKRYINSAKERFVLRYMSGSIDGQESRKKRYAKYNETKRLVAEHRERNER